jgi:hypothetical protein
MRRSFAFLPALLLLVAAPLAAQDPQTPVDTIAPAPAPPAPTDTAAPPPAPADAAPAAPAPAAPAADTAQAAPGHDWEFSLNPASRAPGASGAVEVTSGDPQNSFVVAVSGLPEVSSLDAEEFDAEVYTVWVVPSKDRVPESTLAGVLVVDESGGGRFEGSTDLDTFGIIVAGATEESPLLRAQGAVLTGIPVSTAPPPAETPAAEAPPQPAPEAPGPDAPAPEAPAPDAPAPDPAAPETPAPAAPAPEYPAPSPPPPTPQR